jgi:diguanylate cyclase (GGDEF)-like protein
MEFATISLVIQWVGILVIVGLLLFLTQSIRRRSLDRWAAAWCCLAAALAALYLDLGLPPPHHLLRAAYFFGEYAFGFLLVAGSRAFLAEARPHLPGDPRPQPPAKDTPGPPGRARPEARPGQPAPVARTRRSLLSPGYWRWLPLGLVAALLLAWTTDEFNLQFAVHAGILAAFLLTALSVLLPARRLRHGPGLTVMCASLLLLALDFCHDVPVFALAVHLGSTRRFAYLNYTSIVDLILETVLGFGMVMLTMESLRQESETANQELQRALVRLELLARTDPLTSALNRHAYDSLVASAGQTASALAGCAAVADLNGLKLINDREGHLSGDAAIRRVATAIRSVIRADDLLFRWGGDEFLVVLKHLDEEEAQRRLAGVNVILGVAAPPAGPALSISFGIAAFGPAVTLDRAIEQADAAMYRRKRGQP